MAAVPGPQGNVCVNRRRVQLQIKLILVTYRIERRRRDAATIEAFRERARSLLNELESETAGQADLDASLAEARRELDEGEGPPPDSGPSESR